MSNSYKVPPKTSIGHVHLKVSDLNKALEFYRDLLGFEVTTMYGEEAAFLSAGGYHHHIGLNVWHSKNGTPPSRSNTGLFHTAIRYSERRELAEILQRLRAHKYPLTGASDHGVSEALYLDDPDKNGVELYWDRPEEEWPRNENGSIRMYTRPLDLKELLKSLEK